MKTQRIVPHVGRRGELGMLESYISAIYQNPGQGHLVQIGATALDEAPEDAELLRGGLGKTYFLLEAKKQYFSHIHLEAQAADYPLIDLAIINKTRYEIACLVADRLSLLDFILIHKRIPNQEELQEHGGTFFSGLNAYRRRMESYTGRLRQDISEEGVSLFLQGIHQFIDLRKDREKPYVLFIDSIDSQYLGSSVYYKWFFYSFLPFLQQKCGISIIMAGRKRLDLPNIATLQIQPFNENETREFISLYFSHFPQLLPLIEQEFTLHPDLFQLLTQLTQGKPILLSILCDHIKVGLLDKRFPANSLPFYEFFKLAKLDSNGEENSNLFKKYLITHLNLTLPRELHETSSLLLALSMADYGLDKTGMAYAIHTTQQRADREAVDLCESYIENYFTQEALSYIKLHTFKGQTVVSLHDELIALLTEFHWDVHDPFYFKRNQLLERIRYYYREELLENHFFSESELESKRLEFLHYALKKRGHLEETQAIYECLYEFIRTLDEHPIYAGAILNLAEKYYEKKQNQSMSGKRVTYRQLDSEDPILLNIPLRKVEYLLTERVGNQDWKEQVFQILKLIENKLSELPGESARIYHAQCKLYMGESLLWLNDWDKGIRLIKEAMNEFYLMGEIAWVTWAQHLLGFQQQRTSNFDQAFLYHIQSIDDAIKYHSTLYEHVKQGLYNPEMAYNREFTLKVLFRALSNLGANYTFRGKSMIGFGFRIGMNDFEMPARERRRLLIPVILDLVIMGLHPFAAYLKGELNKADTFGVDPLISTRIPLISATEEFLKSGAHPFIHRALPQAYVQALHQQSPENLAFLCNAKSLLETKFKQLRLSDPFAIQSDGANEELDIRKRLSDEDIAQRKVPVIRELAEWYFLYGKILSLIPQADTGGGAHFDVEGVITGFTNSAKIAHAAKFSYQETKALEMLVSHNFILSGGDMRSPYYKAMQDIMEQSDQVQTSLRKAGIQHEDVRCVYHLHRGDVAFQNVFSTWEALNASGNSLSSDLVKQSFLNFGTAFKHYAKALEHGLKFNYDFYYTVHDILLDRLSAIVRCAKEWDLVKGFEPVKEAFRFAAINDLDPQFENYLQYTLNGLQLLAKDEVEHSDVLKSLSKEALEYRRFAPYKMAANLYSFICKYHIQHLHADVLRHREHAIEQKLICVYTQQRNLYLAGDIKGLIAMISLFEQNFSEMGIEMQGRSQAIVNILKAILIYRLGDLRYIERILHGELAFFAARAGRENLLKAEDLLYSAIVVLGEADNQAHSEKYTPMLLDALSFYAELHLFLKTTWNDPNVQTVKDLLEKRVEGATPEEYMIAPPTYFLYKATILAQKINDYERLMGIWQSLGIAQYHLLDPVREPDSISGLQRMLQRSLQYEIPHPSTGDTVKAVKYYPGILSSAYFILANINLSRLLLPYEIVKSEGPYTHIQITTGPKGKQETPITFGYYKMYLRKEHESANGTPTPEAQTLLREMLWYYLATLNQLANTTQETSEYTFTLLNVLRLIILVPTTECMQVLLKDFDAIWNQFDILSTKPEQQRALLDLIRLQLLKLQIEKMPKDALTQV